MTHIAYRGYAPEVQALVGGELDMAFISAGTIRTQVLNGSVRALATCYGEPPPDMPQVPDVRKSVPGYVPIPVLSILWAPAGTPPDIVERLNKVMAGAIRLVSIERGHDPKRFAYMTFGGGGALHVCAMMREVGVATGLVPRYPGITSALGCVIADMRHDFVRTLNTTLAEFDERTFGRDLAATIAEGRKVLATAAVEFEAIEPSLQLDMLYVGQTHTLAVPVPTCDPRGQALSRPRARCSVAASQLGKRRPLTTVPCGNQ